MTMPDSPTPRKPPRRFWLFAPFVVVLIAVAAWSAGWLAIRAAVAQRMDAAAQTPAGAGYRLEWGRRGIGGYPFRIEVGLDQAKVSEPSGWALAAPRFEAQANAYDLGHWVMAAPQGLVLTRPGAGDVIVTGQRLRVSLIKVEGAAPRLAFEGIKLGFAPAPGAQPFALVSADHLGLYTRPVAADAMEVLLQLDGAAPGPQSLLAVIADRPVTMRWQASVSKLSALHGPDWPSAVRAWSAAGGVIDVAHGEVGAGSAGLTAGQSRLTVADDGRLRGTLVSELRGALPALHRLSQAGILPPLAADIAASVIAARTAGPVTKADLVFQAGVTTLGPAAIGPAPRIY
jgi:hypothetical protein